jgi:hypothetical protein|tara:strand:+ start:354 stop:644 length:291 start_codon:yes stop_codon:yes gene_type:complete
LPVATSKLKVAVAAEQDSPKVRVEMLVLVVDLVTLIIQLFPRQKDLRHPLILLKDIQVEQHIIPIVLVAAVVVPVVLVLMVDHLELVMVEQDLLLL